MRSMAFLPQLADYLMEHRHIYTMRKYRYQPQVDLVEVSGVGICQRSFLREVNGIDDLELYVGSSGFTSREAWWRKALSLNRGCVGPFYLYEVAVRPGEGLNPFRLRST